MKAFVNNGANVVKRGDQMTSWWGKQEETKNYTKK